MPDTIRHEGRLIAILVSHHYDQPGVSFFTPHDLPLQLAYMRHPAGKTIEAHLHNKVPREVSYTQEILLIKRGRLRVDFYNDRREFLESRILEAGDVILIVEGGHGFEVLEEVEMFEVKQGPYAGVADKVRFEGTGPGPLKREA